MGLMNKLRDNTGVILWILVFAFGLIWVLNDVGTFDVIGNTVGKNIIVVDGEGITIDEYSQALDAQMEAYQNQTGEPMPPQMVDLERERVFNALVEDRLLEREMDRLNIKVTDQELYEMVMGPRPHPIILQYFGDGKGGVNRALLQNFIDDPQQSAQWIQIEQYLRQQRRREKLASLISATARVSDQEVLDEYIKRNRSVNTRFVALNYAAIPDNQVQVSDADLRSYYNEHKDDFKRKRTYSIEYVTRSTTPTRADTARAFQELQKIRPRFTEATNDSLFLAQNASEQPYMSRFFRADELPAELAAAIFKNPTVGAIVGPVAAGNQAHLVKIKALRPAEQPAIQARHILFQAPAGDEAAIAKARQEAEQVKAQLASGANFATLARQHSDDPGSAARGGDLRWFGKGRMVPEFESAAFGAPVGQVIGPVKTQYGWHLIEVTAKADREVQFADFALGIHTNAATVAAIQEQMDDFEYYAEDTKDFAGEAKRRKLPVRQATVEAEQQFIPDLGPSRKIMNFLEDGKKGAVSDVIELNEQFVVVHLKDIQPEGFRPFDQVKDELLPRVRLEKKKEIQVEKLQNAMKNNKDLNALAAAVKAPVQTASSVSFNNPVVPGLGREMKFTGSALGLDKGETSDVIAGENAAFVLQVTAVNNPPQMNPTQREQLRNELLSIRRSTIMNQWLASLREKADIEDNRRKFMQ